MSTATFDGIRSKCCPANNNQAGNDRRSARTLRFNYTSCHPCLLAEIRAFRFDKTPLDGDGEYFRTTTRRLFAVYSVARRYAARNWWAIFLHSCTKRFSLYFYGPVFSLVLSFPLLFLPHSFSSPPPHQLSSFLSLSLLNVID